MKSALVLLALCLSFTLNAADISVLLFTPQRVRRLKRDRERQTDRWLAFEKRVKEVPDSSERGIELATYYAVTGDDATADEAKKWASVHPCETIQVQAIQDATADPEHVPPSSANCANSVPLLSKFGIADPAAIADHYLLSLRPEQVDRPSWQQHAAALALVNLDPNGQSTQFLQGWAMEPRFTLHDGPGVVYEFLWANPYLPGVSYQNMDPWWYGDGSLYARSDWTEHACWIHISSAGIQQVNCPPQVATEVASFGSLQLVPVREHCTEVAHQDRKQVIILQQLPARSRITFMQNTEKDKATPDAAGLWRVPEQVNGKICATR